MPDSNITLAPSAHRTGNQSESGRQFDQRRAGPDLPASASPPLAATDLPGLEAAVVLQLHGELAEVEAEWKAFECTADCTAFQSFAWLATWHQHIGERNGTLPVIVLGRDEEGQLLFILPLAIETRGLVRRLTWLGSSLCDYNAPLLAEAFSSRVSAARFAALWRDIIRLIRAFPRLRFDFVDLEKMPPMVGAQRNPFFAIRLFANPSGAYVATLGQTWDDFYAAKRSSATRKKERRQLKHLAEHGAVRFVYVADAAEIERTLDTLFSQKSRAFARMGVEDRLARPGYRAFYLAVAGSGDGSALTHVSRLDVGATPAATSLGLTFRDCYYLVLSSYHDGEISRFGPGRAHLHELIRHAIERGFHKFDFTIGDEPYKRDWSDIEVPLYDHLAAVTIRGAFGATTASAYRRAKRFVKQTPTMWRLFSKARGLAGMLGRR